VRNRNAIFAYSWTATHQILPGSPLYGMAPEGLAASTAWIVVSLMGLDETLSQTVHARHYYDDADIRFGARLSDIMVRLPDASFALDFAKFDDIEPAPLPSWDSVAANMIAEP
jgi:inward rectifier potassium channel